MKKAKFLLVIGSLLLAPFITEGAKKKVKKEMKAKEISLDDYRDHKVELPSFKPRAPQAFGSDAPKIGKKGLSSRAIARIVKKHRKEIQFCYQKALKKSRTLRGNVIIEFTINKEGKVVSSKIKGGSLKNQKIATCVLLAFQRWRFPRAKVPTTSTYPFTFEGVVEARERRPKKK
jgi:TonB family protein